VVLYRHRKGDTDVQSVRNLKGIKIRRFQKEKTLRKTCGQHSERVREAVTFPKNGL
jgi:hypothetical protein